MLFAFDVPKKEKEHMCFQYCVGDKKPVSGLHCGPTISAMRKVIKWSRAYLHFLPQYLKFILALSQFCLKQ